MDYPFSNVVPCPADQYSVRSNMAHEFGHVIGLDHSASTSAVMYAYFSKGQDRSVGTDDRNGYNNIKW
ncbi:matrixin family metalloprotease [Desulfofarcimen acetoxidans]|uniref:matrixin family metalloprotease n=1 Tax=Desulfofarcimen acetoxidans TaxID=58138 RepID=UPI0012FF5A53